MERREGAEADLARAEPEKERESRAHHVVSAVYEPSILSKEGSYSAHEAHES